MRYEPTWLDRAISYFSPKLAYQRSQFRQAENILRRSRFSTYRGAEANRLRNDWVTFGGSADADLLQDLPTLRERSRDLDRNDPWCRSVYSTIAVNAIGTGLVPQSKVNPDDTGASPDAVRNWQRATERIFREHMPYLDLQQRVNGMIKQVLLFRSVIQSGDALDLPVRVSPSGFRVLGHTTEMIEGDRLRTPGDLTTDRVNLRDGVELDNIGRPIAYWILNHHPGDSFLPYNSTAQDFSKQAFTRYPARNALGAPNLYHLFWSLRPGQNRGEPWLAPALNIFKDLGDFMEAKIVAERVGACFGVAIKKSNPMGGMLANTTLQDNQRIDSVEPGMIHYLQENEEITAFSPDLNATDLDQFVQVFVRQMGASIGLPYELITKDFTKTTWHSARASLLESWRFFRLYQFWFAQTYLQPMWDAIVLEAWSRGLLPNVDLLGPNRSAWLRARWVPPGRGYIDPVREVKASIDAIQGGLSTYSDELAQQGKDYEEVFEQQQREAELREKLGLDEEPEPTPSPTDPGSIPRSDLPDEVNQQIDDLMGAKP